MIRLKKGLDIKLVGQAARELVDTPLADSYAVNPIDFVGLTPKLLVKVDDEVKAGTPLFFDKYRPQVLFSSPVSGKVKAVNRGEKRKILEVVIEPDSKNEYEVFQTVDLNTASKESVIDQMLASGLWPMIIQRPYGVIADPSKTPDAVFISGFDSAPLAPEMDFVLQNVTEDLKMGMEVMKKLTPGKVHLGVSARQKNPVFDGLQGIDVTTFDGPHPAGNVGVQIHHVAPIGKGNLIWTVDIQNLAIIGRFFRTGRVDMTKIIAVAGSEVEHPRYQKIISGARIDSIVKDNVKQNGKSIRFICGNVLTGTKTTLENHFGFYANQMTLIPEGNHHEFLGWIAPRLNKFSVSHSYFSWLTPNKKYDLDTNLNGGVRALVMSGQYEKVLPMDIYPVYLLKAILAGDIDKMENLGIYEVIEEDLALCEFVCTSKTEVQQIVRKGLDMLMKELN